MPYIKPEFRPPIDAAVDQLDGVLATLENDTRVGALNYAITRLIHHHWARRRKYIGIVEITGTLVCVLLEFYTRWARHYEDRKAIENGDVVPGAS